VLHEKEVKNAEIRRMIEVQKEKVKKIQGEAEAQEENKNSENASQKSQQKPPSDGGLLDNESEKHEGSDQVPMSPEMVEEKERLDKLRSDKFKFIMDAMASHAIEE
jgi:hypothetical protein